MSERKRGKLSVSEMRYIEQNCFDMDISEIAEELNRTEAPVRKHIDKMNLKARDLTDHEYIINELRDKFWFYEIQNQFDEKEVLYFESMWVKYILQFAEDVTHTEELQIIEVVRTEILINRSMKERRDTIKRIAELERWIKEEEDKDVVLRDVATIQMNLTMIAQLQAGKASFSREHKDLGDKKDKLLKDLKATRDQRKKNTEDIQTNFSAWLRELDDEEVRKREAVSMEIQAVAADKAFERLSEYHEYVDGEVDQPIYSTETIIEEDLDLTESEKVQKKGTKE